MSLYFTGANISFFIAVIIFFIFWSEAVRQAFMWIDDRDEYFEPWIKNSKRLKFIIRLLPNDTFDDATIYFTLIGCLAFPIALLVAILLWPITLLLLFVAFMMDKARDRKRAKKLEQKKIKINT